MNLINPAGLLIVATITLTALSCTKDDIPDRYEPVHQGSTLLNNIEKDPFNFGKI